MHKWILKKEKKGKGEETMADFFKGIKANYTISAILCVVLGLVLLIWPGTTTQLICKLLGAVLFAYGAVQVVLYLFNRDRTMLSQGMLVLGIVFAVIGSFILLKPETIIMAVPVIVGVLIVLHGLHNVAQAIGLKKENYDNWWVAFLLGVLTATLGGVLIYNPFTVVDTIVRMIGLFLIYDGLSDVWILSRVFKVKRSSQKIVDVDYVDVEEEKE